MSDSKRAKYLLNCARELDSSTHLNKLLKSYYSDIGRKLIQDDQCFSSSQMCMQCSMHWQENEFHMKLKSQRTIKANSKINKLIRKLEEDEEKRRKTDDSTIRQEQHGLTKKQKRRAKWLRKCLQNEIVITCHFCQRKTKIVLEKAKVSKTGEKSQTESQVQTKVKPGINTKAKSKNSMKQQIESLSSKPKETQKVTKTNKATKEKNHANASISKIATSKKAKSLVTESKKSKENSLLKLATLLKSQGQTKKTDNLNNRLESLLK